MPRLPLPSLPRLLSRSLQTTAPLPPPAAPLAPAPPPALLPLLPASTPAALPATPRAAVDLLRATSSPSRGIYLLARLASRTYLLHPRDVLTVPRLKPAPAPGTTLRLTRILEVGSRAHAIRSPAADGKQLRKAFRPAAPGAPAPAAGGPAQAAHAAQADFETIPPWVATCELTVVEHTKSPLTRTVLSKRRKGYRKTIENKQEWTRLRVGDVVLGSGEPPA